MNGAVLSPQAGRDIAEIWDYIAKYSEAEADEMVDDLNSKFRLLRQYPYLGRKRDDIRAGYRSVVEREYLVLYRIVRRASKLCASSTASGTFRRCFDNSIQCRQ